jgi:hypothetical protein
MGYTREISTVTGRGYGGMAYFVLASSSKTRSELRVVGDRAHGYSDSHRRQRVYKPPGVLAMRHMVRCTPPRTPRLNEGPEGNSK